MALHGWTFKATPQIYSQLYTIHALYRDHFVSLVYALLPDKSRATYFDMLYLIKRRTAELDLVREPDVIVSDFEAALIRVVRQQFPHAKQCHFHHS